MNSFYTASTMNELLQQLKLSERSAALDSYIGECEADQRRATGTAYQKALADVNAVKAALAKSTPAPKSTGARPSQAELEAAWRKQRAAKLMIHKGKVICPGW